MASQAASIATSQRRFHWWLPYVAVLGMEWRQTWRGWLFRLAMVLIAALAIGYVLHRAAIHHQAGIVQSAAAVLAEVLQAGLVLGPTLMVLLSAGVIASERGTLADSVLSRGISRYAYYLGKWHGRLAALLVGFLLLGCIVVLLTWSLLRSADLSLTGAMLALALEASVLAAVISMGVLFSTISLSTAMAMLLTWVVVHGIAALLWITGLTSTAALRSPILTHVHPQGLWLWMPMLVRGEYELGVVLRAIGWAWLVAFGAALLGLVHFSRCDV